MATLQLTYRGKPHPDVDQFDIESVTVQDFREGTNPFVAIKTDNGDCEVALYLLPAAARMLHYELSKLFPGQEVREQDECPTPA